MAVTVRQERRASWRDRLKAARPFISSIIMTGVASAKLIMTRMPGTTSNTNPTTDKILTNMVVGINCLTRRLSAAIVCLKVTGRKGAAIILVTIQHVEAIKIDADTN